MADDPPCQSMWVNAVVAQRVGGGADKKSWRQIGWWRIALSESAGAALDRVFVRLMERYDVLASACCARLRRVWKRDLVDHCARQRSERWPPASAASDRSAGCHRAFARYGRAGCHPGRNPCAGASPPVSAHGNSRSGAPSFRAIRQHTLARVCDRNSARPPGRGRTTEQERREIGEDFLVPAPIDPGEDRVAAFTQNTGNHSNPVFLPDAKIGLQVVRAFMQKNAPPKIAVAIPWDAGSGGTGLASPSNRPSWIPRRNVTGENPCSM